MTSVGIREGIVYTRGSGLFSMLKVYKGTKAGRRLSRTKIRCDCIILKDRKGCLDMGVRSKARSKKSEIFGFLEPNQVICHYLLKKLHSFQGSQTDDLEDKSVLRTCFP